MLTWGTYHSTERSRNSDLVSGIACMDREVSWLYEDTIQDFFLLFC
jgi:hypothetical protein